MPNIVLYIDKNHSYVLFYFISNLLGYLAPFPSSNFNKDFVSPLFETACSNPQFDLFKTVYDHTFIVTSYNFKLISHCYEIKLWY